MNKGAIPIYALPKYSWPQYSIPGAPGVAAIVTIFYDIETMDIFTRIGSTRYLIKQT